jgi:UDP-N-acetylglucosamine 1-carboxyvinyltransferase
MATFHIVGGRPLSGTYTPSGNKNAVLPMLAAALLTDEPVILQNVPRIDDVHTMLDILAFLGADVQLHGHTVRLCAAGLRTRALPRDLCRKVRSSILFAGPLAARHGRGTLFPPGGDVIGRRRLDTHLLGLGALGIAAEAGRTLVFRRGRAFAGADILLDEASVTATENVVMAATLAPGATTIRNAACEPHVQDLCALLNHMGARIAGIGTNELRVEGVRFLRGASYRVQPDHVEIGSLICAAAVTGGELRVPNVRPGDMRPLERPFGKLGVRWTLQADGSLLLPAGQALTVESDFGAAIPKIEDGVWPNFPSDLMSVVLVLASQARGSALFFEKMFESRMYFVDHLIDMGARIVQCDPHRVIVVGPAPLQGTRLASPDIRAGMALIVAALCAKGRSCIGNAATVDRGYERIEVKLRALGAEITRKK